MGSVWRVQEEIKPKPWTQNINALPLRHIPALSVALERKQTPCAFQDLIHTCAYMIHEEPLRNKQGKIGWNHRNSVDCTIIVSSDGVELWWRYLSSFWMNLDVWQMRWSKNNNPGSRNMSAQYEVYWKPNRTESHETQPPRGLLPKDLVNCGEWAGRSCLSDWARCLDLDWVTFTYVCQEVMHQCGCSFLLFLWPMRLDLWES